MENYESLGTIGEGTYGVVLKCRHKVTGQIVAIKKFKESDDDEQVKKTALREIKILKQLKHENIVSLLEVFRVKGKLYLVFEYVEKTILEEIEKNPEGLDPHNIKRLMWQLVRAIHFCHTHNIIHRDIKPENLLVSRNGVLKLCDFGFARPLAGAGAKYTEYVSTRWYRAPELLVGDVSYGKAVDVWSIGCMFAEITTGLPLFPGDSDIDQLYHIIKCLGSITPRQQELFKKNSLYVGVKLPHATEREPLDARFPQFDKPSLDLLRQTIQEEPLDRWTCAELLRHPFFDGCCDQFEQELQDAIQRDLNDTMSLRKKRARNHKPPPPSRGGAGGGGDEYGGVDSPHQTGGITKPLQFKPMTVMAVAPPPPKEKLHVVVPKKPALGGPLVHGAGVGGGGASLGGAHLSGIVLPTLSSSSMTPSSSSTSTVSIDSTAMSITAMAAVTPHHHPSSHIVSMSSSTKKAGTVLPMPSTTTSSSDHTEDATHSYHQPQPQRMSITSHGARPTIPAASLYHQRSPPSPSPFSPSLSMPQRPPLTAYGKNAPLGGGGAGGGGGTGTPTGSKHSRVFPAAAVKTSQLKNGGGGGLSLQSSMEIYSPAKKANTNSNSSHSYGSPFHATTSKKPHLGGGAPLSTVSPLPQGFQSGGSAFDQDSAAYYVPPKTSHGGGSRRGQPITVAGGGAKGQRRGGGGGDTESHRKY